MILPILNIIRKLVNKYVKSAYKFGLYLMASLIMLSALAIPMNNMNLFSDAMASGKNHDKYDNYQEYDKRFYSDDNQYIPDYNYYYEPMKQHNNQVMTTTLTMVMTILRQISYNNSYEDMKKYSTYPTKDKKYVCQTGQFQGFFVESVEFCKLTIPEGPPSPIGATGPEGRQGIQGLTGETGATGPAGINTLNSTNLYSNTTFGFVLNGQINGTYAACDEGDAVLNGVYSITPSIDPVNSNINVLFEGAASASSSDFADAYGVFVSYSNARGTGAFLAVACSVL